MLKCKCTLAEFPPCETRVGSNSGRFLSQNRQDSGGASGLTRRDGRPPLKGLAFKSVLGVPVMAQQVKNPISIMGMRVPSLALLSGLRMWCRQELWCRWQMLFRPRVAVA